MVNQNGGSRGRWKLYQQLLLLCMCTNKPMKKNGRNTIGASFFSAAYHGFLFESFLGGLGGC